MQKIIWKLMLLLSFSTFAVRKQIHTGDLIAIMQHRYYYIMVRISNMREEHVFEVFVRLDLYAKWMVEIFEIIQFRSNEKVLSQ